MFKKPALELQTTTLWDYPSQHYGTSMQGDKSYKGATPSYIIWNLLQRYTKRGDKILDPMCGSGTTLDVCHDLARVGRGFDLAPRRPDIERADARHLPVEAASVDLVFVDPPYSTHLKYSGLPECIGELDADGGGYYEAMAEVIAEMHRVLRPGGIAGLYVSDSWRKDQPFCPIGFELFALLRQHLVPVDIVAVARHHKTMKKDHWHRSAAAGNYFLRGFNYLFILRKPLGKEALVQAPLRQRSASPDGSEKEPAKPAVSNVTPAASGAAAAGKAKKRPIRVPELSPLPQALPRGKQPKKKKRRL